MYLWRSASVEASSTARLKKCPPGNMRSSNDSAPPSVNGLRAPPREGLPRGTCRDEQWGLLKEFTRISSRVTAGILM